MSAIVLVFTQAPGSSLRCEAFGEFLHRMKTVEGNTGAILYAPTDAKSAMTTVSQRAALFNDGETVRYAPSRHARDRVAAGEDGTWEGAIGTRHKSVTRRSIGSICQFPLEPTGAEGADEGAAEAFVTDWSGIGGSCALAVHPAHPLSTGVPEGAEFAFTGRFCRHPLTGDLLPIWVATWVKPEFGTGAVLVNPAHNKMDLEFSRQAGLPIRFALVPPTFDGTPQTWIKPPYIKSGVAYRTGATDGLPFDQAREKYIATMIENGLAYRYTDNGMGAFDVAALVAADSDQPGAVDVEWDKARRTVACGSRTGVPVRVVPSATLAAAEPEVRSADLTIVTPSSLVETDLLAVRLLLAEPDIEPQVKNAPSIYVVGPATSKVDAEPEVLRLAMLVTGKPLETLTIKPQHVEPCQRFLRVHEELTAVQGDADQGVTPEVKKAAAQVKELLGQDDLKRGFTQLYRLQKQLSKTEKPAAGDLEIYHTLAFVFAGVSVPLTDAAMANVWNAL